MEILLLLPFCQPYSYFCGITNKVQGFLDKNNKLIIFFLLGLILIGLGILSFKSNIFSSGDKVEVLNSTNAGPESPQEDITVEIAGSVEKPGVYKLPQNSRVDDLLIISGGLSVTADREWFSKNVNRAQKLVDSYKLYVFSQSEVMSAKKTGGSLEEKVLSASVGTNISKLININTADTKTLESLNGIGPVYAQKIIEGRIYSNTEELVSKKIIPQKTFLKIKNEISVN